MKALKWLLMRHRPLVLWPQLELGLYGWLARMLANCTEEAYARNKGRMVRLAEYSRGALRDLRVETGIAYDHREKATLQLFRTRKQLDHVGEDTRVLDAYGVPYAVLGLDGCVAAEPALDRVRGTFVGGLRLPGDAHLFTQRLAALCEGLGVTLCYGTSTARLRREGDRVEAVETAEGATLRADATSRPWAATSSPSCARSGSTCQFTRSRRIP